jgi:pimeloyl-ACP methyl ester carboxylesterase
LIGYSLGGGIAANFASYFPDLLTSVVLLAPSGLFRDSHISLPSRVLQAKGYIPENIVTALVRRRLKAGPLVPPKNENATEPKVGVEEAFSGELTGSPLQVLSREYPTLTTAGAVNWQLEHHPGFVASFISSIRYAPIRQETELETWKRLGRILTQRKHEKEVTGLRHDKVLIVLGEKDNVIHKDDAVEDATSILEGNAQFSFFDIGHEFPSVQYDELTTRLIDFWK